MNQELTKIECKALRKFLYPHISLQKVNYSIELIASDNGISVSEAKSLIKQLLDMSMIEEDSFSKENQYYQITNKGKLYLKNQSEITKEKIIWSVIIPVSLSLITSIIVNLLT